MSGYMHAGETGDNTADEASGGLKRKRDDGSGIQHRTKRNRYISIACNECKRRKIKCNGETPCQRCGNLNLDCVYSPNCCSNNFKDSPEFKQLSAQVAELKEQLNNVVLRVNNLSNLRAPAGQEDLNYARDDPSQFQHDAYNTNSSTQGTLPIDPALQNRPMPRQSSQQSRVSGFNPNPSPFGFGLGQPDMHNVAASNAGGNFQSRMHSQNGTAPKDQNETRRKLGETGRDPIWSLSKDEALRLCDAYEVDTGAMFPMLDMDRLKRHASMLFRFIDAISKAFATPENPGPDAIQDQDTDVLKLVLAISLHCEGNAHSAELSKKLFTWVNKNFDSKLLGNVNIKDLQILTLMALYHFHEDHEALAWRVIGLAARLCLEIGLHRSETYDTIFTSEHERAIARNLFWTVYALDHRWSFGTKMSVAIQEEDIDSQLQRPTDAIGYLSVTIDFLHVSSKCGRYISSLDSPSSPGFSPEQVDSLDLEISKWRNSLPQHLRFVHPNSTEFAQHDGVDPNTFGGPGLPAVRSHLYLRVNHLRTSIYSTVWTTTNSILSSTSSLSYAETAVQTAKDTIRVMTHIHNRNYNYRKRKISYDDFLLAALATMFMAVFYAPSHFAESSREEYLQAIEFVRRISPNSFVGKRLRRTIRGLKEIDTKIGLFPAYRSQADQSFVAGDGNSGGYSRESVQSQQNPAMSSGAQMHMGQTFGSPNQNDAHRSAAMTMASLAGHAIDENSLFGFKSQPSAGTPSTMDGSAMTADPDTGQQFMNPEAMADDLTNLFDAFGQYGNGTSMPMGNMLPGDASSGAFGNENMFNGRADMNVDALGGGNDEMLNRLLKGLF